MAYQQAPHGGQQHWEDTRITTDHAEVRRWVEQRSGRPARVRGNLDPDETGLLRIELPHGAEKGRKEALEAIGWEEFFQGFDQYKLALLYRQRENGSLSVFHRLVHRGNLHVQT